MTDKIEYTVQSMFYSSWSFKFTALRWCTWHQHYAKGIQWHKKFCISHMIKWKWQKKEIVLH